MSVDRAEVERIAKLAQLRFGDEELNRLTEEMNRILGHAERLQAEAGKGDGEAGAPAEHAPTGPARDGYGPDGQATGAIAGVRAASVQVPDNLEEPPASFAPEWQDGFFVVPPPPGVTAEPE